jgi:hypothetical protein
MEVKGTALKTTRDFVKLRFPDGYKQWHDILPDITKKYYDGVINATDWFPIKEGYILPIRKVAEIFYAGNYKKCGDEMGQYSAEVALKGFYKVFLLIASPNYLIKKATNIITTFYKPSSVEALEIDSKSAGLKITQFEQIDETLEYRVGGWCKKALELANCNGVSYEITNSLAKGGKSTDIIFRWK